MTRIFVLILAVAFPLVAHPQSQKDRSIVSEDFTKTRPTSKRRKGPPRRPQRYHQASPPLASPLDKDDPSTLKMGVTLWKVQRGYKGEVAKRVAADTEFHEGDLLRISIESPRDGYLYVVDRDWFTDGGSGDTKLIFPLQGEDNRLYAGKLIDIPARQQSPFEATPKRNQTGEMLTIIVSTSPLSLPLTSDALPVSSTQLTEWETMWSGMTERFEMNNGVGLARTPVEEQAAAPTGGRQLTRADPAPQTIYLLTPRSGDGLLFNLLLSYVR